MNVIFEWVKQLSECGFDARAFTHLPDFAYDYGNHVPQIYHLPMIARLLDDASWKRRGFEFLVGRRPIARKRILPELEVKADDIIIVPEFVSDILPQALPSHRCVLLAQDVLGLTRAALSPGFDAQRFSELICTSQASAKAGYLILDREPLMVPLVIDPADFSFAAQKKPVIAFLPRKLPEQSRMVSLLLSMRDRLGDFEMRRLENLPRAEYKKQIHEAAIFLSFSHQEGFGLPPAEAMATGAIVIGYAGVGGEEFFTRETGFPIAESDVINFVQTVEDVCGRYAHDQGFFDELRSSASQHVLSRYSPEKRNEQLESTFAKLAQ